MERLSTVIGEARHKFLTQLIEYHRPVYDAYDSNFFIVHCKSCHMFSIWKIGNDSWACGIWMTADQLGLLRAFDLAPVEVPKWN
jgi:hypothetical protein